MTAPRRLQLRRGNSTAVSTYTGAAGEVVINTTDWTLRVHDGSTVGGYVVTANTTSINANITQANLGMKGYVDLANTIQSQQISAANLGMKGYVDSVASQNIYGNSNVKSYLSGGFDANIIPAGNAVYSLGSITNQWRDLWLSANTLYIGGVPIGTSGGSLTFGGNVVGISDLPSYTGNVSAGNIAVGATTVGNTTTAPTFSVEGSTGNITAGNISAGNITSTGDFGAASVSTPTVSSNTVNCGAGGVNFIQGAVDSVTLTNAGTEKGYNRGFVIYPTGGTGTGFAFVIKETTNPESGSGNISVWEVYNPGQGYTAGDVLIFDSGYGVPAEFIINAVNDVGTLTAGASSWTFDPTGDTTVPGNISLPDNTAIYNEDANTAVFTSNSVSDLTGVSLTDAGNAAVYAGDNVVLETNTSGNVSQQWSFNNSGNIVFPDATTQSTAFSNTAPIITTLNNNITQANIAMQGYVDNSTLTANIGMKGYVDSQSFYSNTKVATYLASHTDQSFGGNVTISGNLTVNGNVTYINVNNFTTNDNIINLADLNPADTLDLGFSAHRTVNFTLQHTGLVRDASANQWRLFSNVVAQPGTTVDFTDAIYDDIQLGNVTSTGNITANYFIGYTQGLVGSITNLDSLNFSVENISALVAGNGVNIGAGGNNNLIVLPAEIIIQNVPLSVTSNIIFSDLSQQNTAWTGTIDYSQITNAYSNVQVGVYTNLSTYAWGANVTAANVGLKGYVDFANTVMKSYVDGQITAANTNVSGGGSNYGNANVASYLITNGYVNTNSAYANSNVTAYTVSMGFTNYSNVNAKAYTESMGFRNYGNTNVIAYLNATGYNLYSNVNVASYLSTATINTTGNITAAWLSGNISVFGNVVGNSANVTIQAGNYTSVFDNQGNVRLPNAYVSGNVVSTYFIGNGSQLTGLPSSYSNVQVAAYLNATGYNLYSNANVASYLPLYGGDISARNITVSGNIALTGNILQINSAIFYGNTITGFSALYAGIPGYTPIPQVIAQFTADFNGYAQINSQNLGTGNQATSDFIATANNGTDSAYFVDFGIAGSGYDPSVAANNNAIGTALTPNDAYLYTAGNTAANGGGNLVIGVQTLNKNIRFFAGGVNANNVVLTIQGNGITTAGNVTGTYFVGSGQFLTGLPTAYSNVNVKAYAESMGYQNYGNVNAQSYTESMGFKNYSNVNVAAYLNATGYNLYSNVNVIAYLAGNITAGNVTATYFTGNGAFLTGLASSYSNVQVATYLPTYTGVVTASNVAVAGNVTAQYLFGNGALLTGIVAASSYSNVQVATYLPTYSGNIANIRLGVAGVLTFADGTTMTSASAGTYSNVQVATYLPTYTGSINAANILVTGANITLGNIQATTAATNTATGALRVMGGVGVAGSLFAGQLNTTGNLVANTVSAYSLNTIANVTASVVNAGTINSAGNVLAQNVLGTLLTASQTNITAVGTLATLNVTGNATVGNLIGTEANTRIIANVYTTTFDIYGNVSFPGNVNVAGLGIKMPARPAFRVNGTGVMSQTTSNVNLKDSAISTVFNQGSYFDATTGKFTAPVAGIYEVLLNARVGNFNGMSQIAVLKNGNNSGGNIVCFWEITTSTGTATHFGVSGTVQLAVGEYLSANILAGNVSFDGNDNWCVTYLG